MSCDQIKKAFRKLAAKHHPDKGGDLDHFQKLSEANDVLSDPEKRKLQDAGGNEAVNEGGMRVGGGGMDIFDLLSGRQPQQNRGGKKRGKDVQFELSVTLEEIFNGSTKKLAIERQIVCPDCDGKGGEGASTCPDCKGRGMVTRMQQLGPGMYTQSTAPCRKCGGEGTIIPDGKRCKKCKAQKVTRIKDTIEVNIDRGVVNEHKYTFSEKADEAPDICPGDLHVIVKEKEHKI